MISDPTPTLTKAGLIRSIFLAQTQGFVTLKRFEESMFSLIKSLDASTTLSMTEPLRKLHIMTITKFLELI
jgi:hypothetical protein